MRALSSDVDTRQHLDNTGIHVERTSGVRLPNRRQSSVSRQHSEQVIGELRRVDQARHIHGMAAVFSDGIYSGYPQAITTVTVTCRCNVESSAPGSSVEQRVRWASDTVRPRVIRAE